MTYEQPLQGDNPQQQPQPPQGYPQQPYPGQPYAPGWQQPPPGWQQYQPQLQPQRRTDGLAIASMVLGIIWVYGVGAILAVIFGHVALRRIARGERQAGRGMAIAGLVLGYIGIAGVILFIILIAVASSSSSSGGY